MQGQLYLLLLVLYALLLLFTILSVLAVMWGCWGLIFLFNVGGSVDSDKVLKCIELNRTESYSGDTRVFSESPKMPQRASQTAAFHSVLMGRGRLVWKLTDERRGRTTIRCRKKNAPDVETAWIASINTFQANSIGPIQLDVSRLLLNGR